jgi:hypothetical protein
MVAQLQMVYCVTEQVQPVLKKIVLFTCMSLTAHAISVKPVENPWYIGGGVGYGSTTWHALVPSSTNQNSAIAMSTPVNVNEGGFLWNIAGGVELFPQFHLEFDYFHYPDAHIYFDPDSLFSYENNDETALHSQTYTFLFQGKFLVPWEDTPLRLYATAGAAWLNRFDNLLADQTVSPTFGLGLNYLFSSHWMGEFGFIYTAGQGESELNPAEDYMPFLYGIYTRILFRFG